MALAKHEDMVEQFTPESADKALATPSWVLGSRACSKQDRRGSRK
jgi:hypothetical protein